MEKAEETLKVVVPEEDLYESSSESDQESGIANESESGIGSLNLEGVEDVAGRRLEDEEEHIWLTEEQKHIFDEIKRKEKERKMEEELSMKLILQMASRERPVPVAAAPSQNQSVQEAKESGKGDSQGRKINCPPKTATQVCSDLLRFGFSPSGGGLRGIRQDMSKSDLKGLKSNYKTVLCELWDTKGRCQYGPDCHFAHGEEELKKQNLGEGNILKGGTGPSQDSAIVEGSNKGGDKEVHINMEVKEFHEPQTPTEVWDVGDW